MEDTKDSNASELQESIVIEDQSSQPFTSTMAPNEEKLPDSEISQASLASSFVPIEATTPLEAIQLIDENKKFNENVLDYVTAGNHSTPSSEYRIVAVFGSQSTGKSTLLNHLFSTSFGVMDETSRQQTTKGIWLAVSPGVSTTGGLSSLKLVSFDNLDNLDNVEAPKLLVDDTIVVMDVEGTDGTERGEDQDFERKAALFALATSEVLIVNLWETQVGWYQGANMGLMKTVFEVNLSLFGRAKLDAASDHKVLLLFVIRDHTGVTSKESLSATLTRDLLRIWDSLNKPSELAGLAFADFFDLAFHTLSHKIYQKEQFLADVKLLGDRFVDRSCPDFLFKPNYCHDIPIEGWTMYAESCWDQIDNNKDLDLPTQQIMVARCKCEELAALCYENFESAYSSLENEALTFVKTERSEKEKSEKTSVISKLSYSDIGASLLEIKTAALSEYDALASKYNHEVYEQRRVLLSDKILAKLQSVVLIYADFLNSSTVDEYAALLNKRSKSTTLADAMKSIKLSLLDQYDQKLAALSLDESIFTEPFSDRLKTDVSKLEGEEKIAEVNSIVNKFLKKLTTGMNALVQSEVSKASDQTWDNIKGQFESQCGSLLKRFALEDGKFDFGIGVEHQLTETTLKTIEFKSWEVLRDAIKKYTGKDNLFTVLKDRFDEKFGYDVNGTPRVYQTTKELETAFTASKNAALDALPNLAIARLSDDNLFEPKVNLSSAFLRRKYESVVTALKMEDVEEEEESDSDDDNGVDGEDDANGASSKKRTFSNVVSSTDQEEVLRKFKRDTDAIFVASKGAIVQSRTQIPYYIYLIILVLGWNEFMAVIRNPFFFSLILLGAAAFYGLYTTNLLGPAMTVGQRVVEETLAMAKQKLREFVVDEHEFHGRNLNKMAGEEIELRDIKDSEEN